MLDLAGLGDDAPLLHRARDGLVALLEAAQPPVRLLHGDAHLNNCLNTPDGPLWTDFEDVCVAPLEWDAACIALAADVGTAGPVARAVYDRVYQGLDAATLDAMVVFRAAVVAQWAAYVDGRAAASPWVEWLRVRQT